MELKQKKYGQTPCLLIVMFKMFWHHHLVQGVLTFIEVQLIIKLMHFMGSLYRSAAISLCLR